MAKKSFTVATQQLRNLVTFFIWYLVTGIWNMFLFLPCQLVTLLTLYYADAFCDEERATYCGFFVVFVSDGK